jgi:outer membrane protein OmpA-like peptidoglycan-associated protein
MKMHKYCRWMLTPLVLAGLMAMVGCHAAKSDASGEAAGNTSIVFPDPARASEPEGLFVNVENLRKVAPGLTKHQLYALLGAPHFNEGVWNVKTWNYLFDFRKSDGSSDYFACQFQVVFGKGAIASEFHWKPEACKSVLDEHAEVAAAPVPVALPKEPIRLASDTLFDFDQVQLTASGRQQLDGLLQQVRSASQVESILVVGYTDRIGSDSYNLALSRRRAEAVRDYLVTGGVPAGAVHVEGRGEADPVASCTGGGRDALIVCLAPDRRVELSGIARP